MKSRDPIVKAFQNNKGVRVQNDVRSNMPAMKKQVAQQQAKFNALPAAAKKAEVVKQVKIAGKFAAETALSATGVGAGKTIAKSVAKKAYESAAKDVAKKAVSAKYPTSNVKKIEQPSSAKIDNYKYSSKKRAFDSAVREAYKEEGSYASIEARAYVEDMTKRNFKNKINNATPPIVPKTTRGADMPHYQAFYRNAPKSKTIRQQDAKRNEIIKNNKKKGK